MRLRNSAIPLIERAYSGLDLPRDQWLDGVREECERLFDGVLGPAQAWQFELTSEGRQRTVALSADEPHRTIFLTGHAIAPTAVVKRLYLEGPVQTVVRLLAGDVSERMFELIATVGVADVVAAIGLDPSGRGAGVSWLRSPCHRRGLTRDVRHALSRIAVHVGSAARLRERTVAGAEEDAVLSPDGRVLHAERSAREDEPLVALREAAVRIDRARTRRAGADPDEAAAMWRALVDGRWSLIERFESDGRRFLIARRNDPTTRADRALTERERKVVALTAIGHPLKVAAYELGLSEASVSLALRRAMDKMGVRTRAALVELHGTTVAARDQAKEAP